MAITDLIINHRYREAASKLMKQLQKRPKAADVHAELGRAMLCLGKFERALKHFKAAHAYNKDGDIGAFPHYDWLGAAHWLVGNKAAAIQTFREAVEHVEKGIIRYGDFAGGASHGLLLWYGGITAKDEIAIAKARNYLNGLTRRKKPRGITNFDRWPCPLALLVLGRMNPDQVLDGLVADLEKVAREEAEGYGACPILGGEGREDLPVRKQFVQALFYIAIFHRAARQEKESKKYMFLSGCVENPCTIEWFLARKELGWLGA
jgi:tetratricopeptide (TPR) repeat protein